MNPKSETFNLDCLIAMRAMPDKCFDLAIVDPPYRDKKHFTIEMRRDTRFVKGQPLGEKPKAEYFEELFRVSKNQIIWGANNFNLPPYEGFVIWRKTGMSETFSMSMAELAYVSKGLSTVAKVFDYTPHRQGIRFHPTQKPVALYRWLLQNYAKQGDSILDTHLGSGSSRIAAYDLGFDFTGFELDRDYFDAQERRFAEHIKQPKLFEPVQVKAEQSALF